MITNTTDSMIPVMFTQSYQWRLSYGSITNCSESSILNQSPMLGSSSEYLVCVSNASSCTNSNYQRLGIQEYCTDFSALVDSSSGLITNVENITAGAQFCVAYQGGDWTKLYATQCGGRRKRGGPGTTKKGTTTKKTTISTTTSAGCFTSSAGWSIGTCVDLTLRPDGFIDTPPVATVISRKFILAFIM
jgi:hypothetical protein